jgi:hypothetical protein
MAGKPPRSRVGMFSRASAVRDVDGRTREARIVRDTTAALVEHLGGQPPAPQRLLIHASAMLALLGDGMPRTEATIVATLADRHLRDDIKRTLMRLDVVGRLDLRGSRYTLPASEAEPG